MTINSDADVQGLFAAGRAVRAAFEQMRRAARPGMTTAELDAIGHSALARVGARSASASMKRLRTACLASAGWRLATW